MIVRFCLALLLAAGVALTAGPSAVGEEFKSAPSAVGQESKSGLSAVGEESRSGPSTVVSLTFDDGWKSQLAAADALTERGMLGTFYIASGQVGYPAFMTVKQLRKLQRAGHEIGGHTISHPRLSELPLSKAKFEVCSDRAGLLKLGLRVTSFAYPYGDYDAAVKRIPERCGYNSARAGWGLYGARDRCDYCTNAEDLAASNRWTIRPVTAQPFMGKRALPNLKRAVRHAEVSGGGWLPLLFHHICAPRCKDPGIALGDFESFLDWLAKRQPSTEVRTVDEVVSGPVRPAVGTAQWQIGGVPLVKPITQKVTPKQKDRILANAQARQEELEYAKDAAANTAFTIPAIDVGQLEVIAFFCGATFVGVIVFRFGTRRRRYEW